MNIVDGAYLYERFTPAAGETLVEDASLYEIRIGLVYEF